MEGIEWANGSEYEAVVDNAVFARDMGLRYRVDFTESAGRFDVVDERIENDEAFPGFAEPYFFYRYQNNLADKKAMADFFGQGFNVNALPQQRDIELVAKEDVYLGIHNATARCKTKTPYGKGEHSFKVLKVIAPENVCEASPWARRFVETLTTIMGG